MFINSNGLRLLGMSGFLLLSLSFISSAQAQICTALNVIGANGTSVKKTVSPFSTLVTNNNWNTDFAVPSEQSFSQFVATIVPENIANYDLELNLKYSDESSDTSYKKENVGVTFAHPLNLVGRSRPNSNPYQVNVFIGGLNAIGNTYTVSVEGCS
ncbi:hypothetical protein [Pseudanabaena sp. UWO310]|uniref:hypothetical protein n=1 Tax=Pseudanabaena sp. UWO310 TaxID=2480795 RepID=UPI001160C295|nr:hypothetical protein [Pseudanabaena sp. UWO310]TYQ25242.1 hypothetical protein PseudUWO310_19405 [Pseudanabaena sp. UWO310]